MIDLALVGTELAEVSHTYSWRDVVLYALGVGAKVDELSLLYEGDGLKVLPTFATVPSGGSMSSTDAAPIGNAAAVGSMAGGDTNSSCSISASGTPIPTRMARIAVSREHHGLRQSPVKYFSPPE